MLNILQVLGFLIFFFARWAFSKQGAESMTKEQDDILKVATFS